MCELAKRITVPVTLDLCLCPVMVMTQNQAVL